MPDTYSALPCYALVPGAGYFKPRQDLNYSVAMADPALYVMTDLRQVAAVTTDPYESLDAARDRMMLAGVRMLLVTDPQEVLIGLITATDVQGEKPLQFLEQVGGRHEEILVGDIMVPQRSLEVLDMEDVRRAAVGDVVATLTGRGRQHALVVDTDPQTGRQAVRGIFSATQISRQLGTPLVTARVAQSFAELGLALNRH